MNSAVLLAGLAGFVLGALAAFGFLAWFEDEVDERR